MLAVVNCAVAIAVLISHPSPKERQSPLRLEEVKQEKRLEGAYEFVSEVLELTKPKVTTERLSPPEWTGLWLFEGGRFSQTMMKKGRGYLAYPRSHAAIGYESSAGTYVTKDKVVRLERDLSLHPLSVGRPITFEYRFEADTLILVETMHPYTENIAEGKRTIVLRRIR